MKNKRHKLSFHFAANALLFLLLIVVGCGKSGANNKQADAGLPAEAIAVRNAFESAAPGHKHPVTEVLSLVKAGSVNRDAYTEALPKLQMLAANPTISTEQKKSLEALVEKLKVELASRKIR